MGQIVAAYAYDDGRRVREIELGESRGFARSRNEFVWIGFLEPTEAELRGLQEQFDLHELAVEDALLDHHAPKLEVYGRSLFVVLRTAEFAEGRILFGHSYIFMGPDYIITVRRGPSKSYAPVRSRCEADPDLLRLGVDYVLYELLTFVLDNYVLAIENLQEAGRDRWTDRSGPVRARRHPPALCSSARACPHASNYRTNGGNLFAVAHRRGAWSLMRKSGPTSPICTRTLGPLTRAWTPCARFWISGSRPFTCRSCLGRAICRDASQAGRQFWRCQPLSPAYTA